MQNIIIQALQIILIFILLPIAIFNLLYAKRVKKTSEALGIHLPDGFEKLLKANIILPLISTLLILLFLLKT